MSVLVVAEAGVNHDGSIDVALALVDAAAEAGADAVKFQTFEAEAMISRRAPRAEYQARNTGEDGGQLDMIRALQLDVDAHRLLIARCAERGIRFLSTPFDFASLRMLLDLGLSTIKVSSGDATNTPFLVEIGRRARHVILSTGMCDMDEVDRAVKAVAVGMRGVEHPTGSDLRAPLEPDDLAAVRERLTLLQCTTEYPAPVTEANLRAMLTMRDAFGVAVGYSDHTLGMVASPAAVALGATVIERHLTLDRLRPGPDHAASLEPDDFRELVRTIREVEAALGDGKKRCTEAERKNRVVARKSVVAAHDVVAGSRLTPADLALKRPGDGRSPIEWFDLLDTRSERDVAADEPI